MEDTFLKRMKSSLVELKKEILKNLASESEDFRTIIEDLDPKKIPRERLEAIPYAVLCIDCKSSEERRNR